MIEIKTPQQISGSFLFNNGQYAERINTTFCECYSLQIIDSKITGMYWHKEDGNGRRFDSCCYSVIGLKGKKLEVYNQLIALTYEDTINRLSYAKNFTPHKVSYYEDIITAIVTRKQ